MKGPDILVPYDEWVTPDTIKALVDALREYAAPSNWTAENHLVKIEGGVSDFEVIWTYHGYAPEHDERPWEPAAAAIALFEDESLPLGSDT